MRSQRQKAERFRALHLGAPFLIPTPGTAAPRGCSRRSASRRWRRPRGFAFTLGRADGEVTLDEVVEHTDLVDGERPAGLGRPRERLRRGRAGGGRAIEAVAAVGAVGGSIEDWEAEAGIYEIGHAAERIAAAAAVARELASLLLTARAENHIRGNPDLDDTIARLRAYEESGRRRALRARPRRRRADRRGHRRGVKPVNVLARPSCRSRRSPAGAQRISVGGALAWATSRRWPTRDGDARRGRPQRPA